MTGTRKSYGIWKKCLNERPDPKALDAVAYNLAFITPLIVIFAMAFTGMSNKALIDFQTRHTFSVKIALGLVFLVLAAVILFGARML
jgi:hypothetical protein